VEPGDRTSNLPVARQPLLPPELLPHNAANAKLLTVVRLVLLEAGVRLREPQQVGPVLVLLVGGVCVQRRDLRLVPLADVDAPAVQKTERTVRGRRRRACSVAVENSAQHNDNNEVGCGVCVCG